LIRKKYTRVVSVCATSGTVRLAQGSVRPSGRPPREVGRPSSAPTARRFRVGVAAGVGATRVSPCRQYWKNCWPKLGSRDRQPGLCAEPARRFVGWCRSVCPDQPSHGKPRRTRGPPMSARWNRHVARRPSDS